jgi:outer membrane protein TolC
VIAAAVSALLVVGNLAPPPLAFSKLSLSDAQAAAVANSPDVAMARAREDSAHAAYAQISGTVGPALFANVTTAPQAGPTAGTTIASNMTTVGAQSTFGDLLGYAPASAQARSSYHSAQAQTAAAVRAERSKTATLYFGALKARAALDAAVASVRSAMVERGAAIKRFGAGDAPHVDVVRADVALARAQAAEENARGADANATDALRLETGTAPAIFDQPLSAELPPTPDFERDPARAVEVALASRPEIRAAREDIRAADSGVRVAKLSFLPAVSLSAGYARGTDSGQHVNGPSVTAQLTLPLSAAPSARVAQAQAALAMANASLASAQRQATIEVAAAVRTLAASTAAASAAARARQQTQVELGAVELGYRSGASSSLEVEQARSVFAVARADELTAVYDEAIAQATLAVEVNP